jgi:hypothetical protein
MKKCLAWTMLVCVTLFVMGCGDSAAPKKADAPKAAPAEKAADKK